MGRANSQRSGWLIGISLVLAAPVVWAQSGGARDQSELDRLRDAILEVRERVGAHEREEREIFARLEEIDRGVEALRDEVRKAERETQESRARLEEAEARLVVGEKLLAGTRRAMSKRVVALYKTGQVGPLRVLFSSGSLQELFGRASALRKLLEHDAELVSRFRREAAELEVARAHADRRTRELEYWIAELANRSRALDAERASKRVLLARVREDRGAERAVLVELENAARALEETLANLGGRPTTSGSRLEGADFAALRGRLPPPVDARVAAAFGKVVDERYLTETFRKGVEFDAAAGDSVRAVAFGEVRYSGWFRGYGKIIIVDHGDQYFTVSGHLDEAFVGVGTVVDMGETLGSVGETGSLTGPSLYFEVRRGSEPLDPDEWLRH